MLLIVRHERNSTKASTIKDDRRSCTATTRRNAMMLFHIAVAVAIAVAIVIAAKHGTAQLLVRDNLFGRLVNDDFAGPSID